MDFICFFCNHLLVWLDVHFYFFLLLIQLCKSWKKLIYTEFNKKCLSVRLMSLFLYIYSQLYLEQIIVLDYWLEYLRGLLYCFPGIPIGKFLGIYRWFTMYTITYTYIWYKHSFLLWQWDVDGLWIGMFMQILMERGCGFIPTTDMLIAIY